MSRCPCEDQTLNPSAEAAAPAPAAPAALLADRFAAYPRVVRLRDSGALLATFDGGANNYPLYESRDDGATWSPEPIVEITDFGLGSGSCCAALFELPTALGAHAAGTLLFAAAFGKDSQPLRMGIRLYRSGDGGRTWTALGSIVEANGGLWEPEFTVTADGRLACYFADESQQPRFNQTISVCLSEDGGASWGAPMNLLADGDLRPGMPVVRRLPDGTYVMVYERCNDAALHCALYLKTSPDGLDWGDPTYPGEPVVSSRGKRFAGTPSLALGADALILTGQRLHAPGGEVASGNGGTLFAAPTFAGPWLEVAAPIAVPEARGDHFCPNYSPALLPSADGTRLLEITTALHEATCKAFYATAPMPDPSRLELPTGVSA